MSLTPEHLIDWLLAPVLGLIGWGIKDRSQSLKRMEGLERGHAVMAEQITNIRDDVGEIKTDQREMLKNQREMIELVVRNGKP
jgi:diphthamide biosynthesis methyltransferase